MICEIYQKFRNEVARAYTGNEQTIRALFVALISGGHVLLEGVPGLAKTTLARALSLAIDAEFHRIQFTMDLMPSDITGSNIYRVDTGEFKFIEGPVFTNVLLADEINRASARTQSALLEAMQERQVSVDGKTYELPKLFFVIATQNPNDERGTYLLPDSELDRFMFRICLDYPTAQAEKQIILQASLPESVIRPVIKVSEILALRESLYSIRVSDNAAGFIADLIRQTRVMHGVERGASPRAGTMLLKAARGFAYLRGGEFLTPDDVLMAFPLVLNHRIVLSDEVENQRVEHVLKSVMDRVSFK